MADIDNENTAENATSEVITLSDTSDVTTGQPSRILLLRPDGLVSPATIDESGVVRELHPIDLNTDISANDDILQQAFQEAGTDFVDENGAMTTQIASEEQMDSSESGTISYVTTEDGQIRNSIIESTFTGEDGNQYAILRSEEDGSQHIVMTSCVEESEMEPIAETTQLPEQDQQEATEQLPELIQNGDANTAVFQTEVPEQPNDESSMANINERPLGSSENPIRIIQQGNQYTSLQQLTPEQLQHILQVLQQQQVVKPMQRQGATTLYSPQTNTKIVYRVIYPGEKKEVLVKANNKFTLNNFPGRGRGRGRGKPLPGTRGRGRPRKYPLDEETDANQFPELSKEEKEKRKKMRPRTRSGRVSKPPKHMVKDYKQIHLVDWAEDYDDSDGGYSDFRPSDEENDGDDDNESVGMDENGVRKSRGHVCQLCGKSYIGQGSLNRHFRLNPTHGTPTDDGRPVPNGAINEESNSSSASVPGNARYKRTFRRGKLPQRLSNLREVVKHFTNEELMEIVLPRLTQCVSTWEFMLMKSERPEQGGTALRPSIPEMLREYELLLKDVRQYSNERLNKVDDEPEEKENAVKVDDSDVASSLGLQPAVWYQINNDDQPYIPMKYKFSKAASNFKEKLEELNSQVQSENLEPPEPLEPPVKRVRIDEQGRAVNGSGKVVTVRPAKTRSLLTNQVFESSHIQTITLSPSNMKGQGRGQPHGRIILEKGSNDSGPSYVSLNTGTVPGTLQVSDLISIRAGDEDDLVMDTGGEIGDVTHSPEAMLQTESESVQNSSIEPVDSIQNKEEELSPAQSSSYEAQTDSNLVSLKSVLPEGVSTSLERESESSLQTSDFSNELSVDEPKSGADSGSIVIMQTDEGMLLIERPDGSTLQVQHSGEGLTMETVQYLLSMDTNQLQMDSINNSVEVQLPNDHSQYTAAQ